MSEKDIPAAPASGVDSPGFLDRLKALEPGAIETVYQLYGPALLRYAYRQTGDWAEAQDIASEAFVRLLESIERYQPQGSTLLAWLYRVARNLAIDRRRRMGRHPEIALQEVLAAAPAAEAEFSAEAHDLVQALAALSAEHREVLLLRFREGLSAQEVAAALGRSPAAVRALQHRALQALRSRLEAGGA